MVRSLHRKEGPSTVARCVYYRNCVDSAHSLSAHFAQIAITVISATALAAGTGACTAQRQRLAEVLAREAAGEATYRDFERRLADLDRQRQEIDKQLGGLEDQLTQTRRELTRTMAAESFLPTTTSTGAGHAVDRALAAYQLEIAKDKRDLAAMGKAAAAYLKRVLACEPPSTRAGSGRDAETHDACSDVPARVRTPVFWQCPDIITLPGLPALVVCTASASRLKRFTPTHSCLLKV